MQPAISVQSDQYGMVKFHAKDLLSVSGFAKFRRCNYFIKPAKLSYISSDFRYKTRAFHILKFVAVDHWFGFLGHNIQAHAITALEKYQHSLIFMKPCASCVSYLHYP